MKRGHALVLASLLLLILANACPPDSDWITQGDPIDPDTGLIYEIVPGTPRIAAGPDGEFDTADDVIGPEVGDIDLVIRSVASILGTIPPTAPLRAGGAIPTVLAEMALPGAGIPFTVAGSTGVLPLASAAAQPYFPGHPILVMAFADLDGDGYIGITLLDGDRLDFEIEEAELVPVARRYATVDSHVASGELFVPIGGPPGAELDIVLAAVTYSGPRLAGFLGGGVPVGPAIMTRLPFPPQTALIDVVGDLPGQAGSNALVGPEIKPLVDPDPANPRIGEAFTLRLDGSQPSIDLARVESREFVRFGFGLRPDLLTYSHMASRPLRPGLGDAGERVVYEMLHHLTIPDDGPAGSTTLRILPIDRMGNIAALPHSVTVELVASGSIQI